MQFGLGGLASGFATGMGQGIALNRQAVQDKQAQEAHDLAMQQGQLGLAAGTEKLNTEQSLDKNAVANSDLQTADAIHTDKVNTMLRPVVSQIALGDNDGAMQALVDAVNKEPDVNKGHQYTLVADKSGKPVVDADGNYTATQVDQNGNVTGQIKGTPQQMAMNVANSPNPMAYAQMMQGIAAKQRENQFQLTLQGLKNQGDLDSAAARGEHAAAIDTQGRIKTTQMNNDTSQKIEALKQKFGLANGQTPLQKNFNFLRALPSLKNATDKQVLDMVNTGRVKPLAQQEQDMAKILYNNGQAKDMNEALQMSQQLVGEFNDSGSVAAPAAAPAPAATSLGLTPPSGGAAAGPIDWQKYGN